MGATFPLAMGAIRRNRLPGEDCSFSYLYLANVLGATSGTLASGFVLIEVLGFTSTLLVAALLNALLAGAALWRSRVIPAGHRAARPSAPERGGFAVRPPTLSLALLFLTGLVSMALEVVWIRQFTPYLGTLVYAFAGILGVHLLANFAGSGLYRRRAAADRIDGPGRWFVRAWVTLGTLVMVALVTADPRLPLPPIVRVVVGIVPFCVAVGFLTPMLADRWSAGDPDRAGRAYAVNVIGCILGPLGSGFWLLPAWGERGALVALALPLFAVGLLAVVAPARLLAESAPASRGPASLLLAVSAVVAVAVLLTTREFESRFPVGQIRRDHTATSVAIGSGRRKQLLVNGVGMTQLTPMTKMMAHLPLVALDRPPRAALVVCLGMGTSFRSLLSWNIPVTAVELVPSVPQLLPYFHPDQPPLGTSPLARIVIDDGRRFLERSGEQYDVITIDPPPPVSAAGSSLLYSREFYEVAKRRLRPDGVLQQWIPGGDALTLASIARALVEAFPHVRVFVGLEGWGLHFLASRHPVELPAASGLAARLPAGAEADMLEWGPAVTAEEQLRLALSREVPPAAVMAAVATVPPLSDDRPYNEYFLLRRYLGMTFL
jgi:predicted membrane-bound spermidine synthase